MRIRKDQSTKNEYIAAGNVWIRNFTKTNVKPFGLNNIYRPEEYKYILDNETKNLTFNHMNIGNENFYFPKVVIVSDGYKFKERQAILSKLPKDVAIIAINGALVNWSITSETFRPINLYLINNPFPESVSYLPRKSKYYPACVASLRTYPNFVRQYQGQIYRYTPTPDRDFGIARPEPYFVDDYRSPVCAAISLSFRFGVEKMLLFCCDDSFEDSKPGAVKLSNGFWTYLPHMQSQQIVDSHLYWLTHQEELKVKVRNYSSGGEYEHAPYISEDSIIDFFNTNEDEGL